MDNASDSRDRLIRMGFLAPSWVDVARRREDDWEDVPRSSQQGWQHKAVSVVQDRLLESIVAGLTDSHRALLRSQGGHLASSPFTTPPLSFHARFDPQQFRVLLLRPLAAVASRFAHLPVWPSTRFQWPTTVQHARLRESLAEEGLWWRMLSPKCAEKREVRVSCNIFGRSNRWRWGDASKWWQTASHSSMAHSWLWMPPWCLHTDVQLAHNPAAEGTHIPRTVRTFRAGASGGVGIRSWREVVRGDQPLPPATRQLNHSKTSAKLSWLRRWRSILACTAAKAFAQSLLEQRGGTGVDGPTPRTPKW